MQIRSLFALIMVISLFLAGEIASSAVLQLRNGQNIEGTFAGGSADQIQMKIGSQMLTFPMAEVARIEFVAAVPRAATADPGAHSAGGTRATEVIDQLRRLNSATEAGIDYTNYSSQVIELKIRVDESIRKAEGSLDPAFRDHVAKAMCYYTEARQAWSMRVTSSWTGATPNSCLRKCKRGNAAEIISGDDNSEDDSGVFYVMIGTYALSDIWACANDETDLAAATLR